MSFENIISHSIGCLFYLLMVSYAIQKLVHWIKSHSFIFALISFALGDRSPKILLWFMTKSVLLMYPSKSFTVSGFTFRSLIHFEFIFVNGVRKCSNFMLLHVAAQFSQHQFSLKTVFCPLYILASPVHRSAPTTLDHYFSHIQRMTKACNTLNRVSGAKQGLLKMKTSQKGAANSSTITYNRHKLISTAPLPKAL